MARELAVALVHTARVLEVLVSIVTVGEHLAAPLAVEPLALAYCNTH